MAEKDNKSDIEDVDYDEALNSESLKFKSNYMLYRLRKVEERLDNGISEEVFRNSWAIGIFGAILIGLCGALISGAI